MRTLRLLPPILFALATFPFRAPAAPKAEPILAPERVVLETIAGDIMLALYPEEAPQHVKQFLTLVKLGAYDTIHFYRSEPGFVLQTSLVEDRLDRLSPAVQAVLRKLPLEIGTLKHERWVLSMARADGDRNSATSSFSILLGKAPHLDGEYTIFGRVTGGFDVVEELTRVPRTPDNRPSVRLTIRRARVLEARELATASLAPAQSVHRACEAPAPVHAPAMLLMVALSLIAFFFRDRVSSGFLVSLHLANVLVAGFALFASSLASSYTSTGLAIAVAIGTLGLFRLMGRFEEPGR